MTLDPANEFNLPHIERAHIYCVLTGSYNWSSRLAAGCCRSDWQACGKTERLASVVKSAAHTGVVCLDVTPKLGTKCDIQVIKCNTEASGAITDKIDVNEIASAVRSQLQVDLAPQLINILEPYKQLGQQTAELRMILPNGERPALQILLTT